VWRALYYVYRLLRLLISCYPPGPVSLTSEALLAVAGTLLIVVGTWRCLLLANLFAGLLDVRFGLIIAWICYYSILLVDLVIELLCWLLFVPTCLKLEAWCRSFELAPFYTFCNLPAKVLGAGLGPPSAFPKAAYWLFFERDRFVL